MIFVLPVVKGEIVSPVSPSVYASAVHTISFSDVYTSGNSSHFVHDCSVSGTVESSRGRGGDGSAGNPGGGEGNGDGTVTGGFLFDSADLLDAVSAIRSPNRSDFLPVEGDWGMLHVSRTVVFTKYM